MSKIDSNNIMDELGKIYRNNTNERYPSLEELNEMTDIEYMLFIKSLIEKEIKSHPYWFCEYSNNRMNKINRNKTINDILD